MNMGEAISEGVLRWLHVVAGILWIGHLYFFNFVNSQFAPTLDADSKKKVVPELMPRALFWFRWGAFWTWLTGVLLMVLVFYKGAQVFDKGVADWNAKVIGTIVLMLLISIHIYDVLFKKVFKTPQIQFIAGLVLASGAYIGTQEFSGFSFRGSVIHLGAMFGTLMAFNVWFRIWPAQQKIVTAIKNGEKPDADVVALAGLRSKHNTYMSVPLILTMLNAHLTGWAGNHIAIIPGLILVGWLGTYALYAKSKKVKGF